MNKVAEGPVQIPTKIIYSFARKDSEGNPKKREILGLKGAKLVDMSFMGIPVPAGFIVTSEISPLLVSSKELPDWLKKELTKEVEKLERTSGKRFGDPSKPLLLSVRASTPYKFPDYIYSFLNVGITEAMLSKIPVGKEVETFPYDAYLRLLYTYSKVVMGLDSAVFLDRLEQKKTSYIPVPGNYSMPLDGYKELINEFQSLFLMGKKADGPTSPWSSLWGVSQNTFPTDPYQQLFICAQALYTQWDSPLSKSTRERNGVSHEPKLALIIQEMVFGNYNNNSLSGVAFSRNLTTGEKEVNGEFMLFSQGQEFVTSNSLPKLLNDLKTTFPQCFQKLIEFQTALEYHFRNVQEIEFVVEENKLWILQSTDASCSAHALIRTLCDMQDEKLITQEEALSNIELRALSQLLTPAINPAHKTTPIGKGIPGSPGAASGEALFDPKGVVYAKEKGIKAILVKNETSSMDFSGIYNSVGVLTAHGRQTSHAAESARNLGIPCVTGLTDLAIDKETRQITIGSFIVKEHDIITIDGSTGEVFLGDVPRIMPGLDENFYRMMKMADQNRRLKVRGLAINPNDVKLSVEYGAEGVNCHTDFMFLNTDRIDLVREAILTEDADKRRQLLMHVFPLLKKDFISLIEAAQGLPLNFRLIDPPLHEYLPRDPAEVSRLAKKLNMTAEDLWAKLRSYFEFNPMLGHRGVRAAVTHPEFFLVQVRALTEAVIEMLPKLKQLPEIAVPFVGKAQEMVYMRNLLEKEIYEVSLGKADKLQMPIGAVIEVPSAILNIASILPYTDFLMVGSTDLTQITLGMSEADSRTFIQTYLARSIYDYDPFVTLDQSTVGVLLETLLQSVKKSDTTKVPVYLSGNLAGDPLSIEFTDDIDMTGIVCKPVRVPIAKMAATLAVYKRKSRGTGT